MTVTRRRSAPHVIRRPAPAAVIRHVLDNGLVAVLCPREHLAHAYVALYFGVGSRHETPANNGITHVLEHMLFRGTRSFPDATALNAAAEDFGGFLEGATYRDHLSFSTSCHPNAVGQAIHIISELVRSPRYRAMGVERAILREELLETLDGAGRMIDLDNIAHRAVFGKLGLGLPIEGSLVNLAWFKQRDLDAHRRQYLVGANGVISIAGPIDTDRVFRQLQRSLGRIPRGTVPVAEPPPPPRAEPVLRFVRDASSQVDIRITFPAAPIRDPRYPALVMLGRILADGLASRMHAELVDRRGLAYALNAGLNTYADTGLFEFEVAVAPDRAAEAVQSILDFAHAAGRFRFAPGELQRARRRYRYGMEFMADSPADLASWHGGAALFGVDKELAALGGRIARLHDAEIRAAARQIFRRRGLAVTAVGELARGEWRRVRRIVDGWG